MTIVIAPVHAIAVNNGVSTSWNYYVTDHLGNTRMVVGGGDSIRETGSYCLSKFAATFLACFGKKPYICRR